MDEFEFGVLGWWRAWYKKFFREKWPLWLSAIFMAISGIMAYGIATWSLARTVSGANPYDQSKPLGTFLGLKELGGIINNLLGKIGLPHYPFSGYIWPDGTVNFFRQYPNPLLEPTAGTMLGILFGGLVAALLAKEFALKVPLDKSEYGLAVSGGVMMGFGAVFMFGCPLVSTTNIGAMGVQSILMVTGMTIGSYFGAKIIVWLEKRRMALKLAFSDGAGYRPLMHFEKTRTIWPRLPESADGGEPASIKYQPHLALALMLAMVAVLFRFGHIGYPALALSFGAATLTGFAMQRGGICFAHAYREPFLSGFADMSRAMALLYILLILGFLPMKLLGAATPDLAYAEIFAISPAGVGVLIGAALFGVGMALNGACVSDSLWRTAEGQVKIWIGLLTLICVSSWFFPMREEPWFKTIFAPYGSKNIRDVYLPHILGSYPLAVALMIGIIVLWALLLTWFSGRTFRKYMEG
ncbi:MAG: YeeE/YedE thiosulfate transporter family protein [Nitrospiraceae bacterium]|nr:YeeE/YedE thiosulfate transporter family protein [Nitrospiraceae bacterium]